MAFDDLFGSLSPEDMARERANQGLLGLAAGLLQAGGASRLPVSFGQALGQGLLGMQQFRRAANEDALNAAKLPLYQAQAAKTKTEVDLVKAQTQEALRRAALSGALGPELMKFIQAGVGGSGASATDGSVAQPGGTKLPMSADGVVPDVDNLSDPRGKVPVITAAAQKYGVDPTTALKVAKSEGLATFLGDAGKSGGAFQLYTGGGVGNQFERDTGLNPLDPKNEDATIDYAMKHAAENGWGAWNGAKRIGITGYMGIGKDANPAPTPVQAFNAKMLGKPTQVAQADPGTMTDAGGGDTLGTPSAQLQGDASRVTNSFGPPGTFKMNSKGQAYSPDLETMSPEDKARVAEAMAGIKAQMAAGAPPPAPIQPKVPPAQMMGGGNISVPPPQPIPAQFAPQQNAAPPQLQPGGALRPPAVPPMPAPPNIDPRRLAAMGALGQLAGLGDITKPFETYYYGSPGYKGQIAGAEAAGKYPYDTAQEDFKQRLAAALAGPTEKAKREAGFPYDVGLQQSQGDINRESERLKQEQAAGLDMVTVNINGRDVPMTRAQAAALMQQYNPPAPQQGAASGQPPAAPGVPGQAGQLQLGKPTPTDEQKGRNEVLKTEYGEVVKQAGASQDALVPLVTLENALHDFRTGPTRERALQAARIYQDLLQTVGAKPDPEMTKMVASGEIITKEGNRLGFELARTLGSREAQMIVQQAIASNPGLKNSPQGNEQLIALLKQGLQRDMDKRVFVDNWFNDKGTHDGATAAFNKAAPVQSYITKVLPSYPKDAGAYDALPPGTTFVDPQNNIRVKPYSAEWSAYMPSR